MKVRYFYLLILFIIFYSTNFSFASESIPFGYHLEKLTNKEERRIQEVNSNKMIKLESHGYLMNLSDRKRYLSEKDIGYICEIPKFFNYSEKITPSRYLKDPKELRKSAYSEILIHKIILSSSHFFGSYNGNNDDSVDAGEFTLKLLESYAKKNYPSMDQKNRYGHTVGSAGQFFLASAWAIQLLEDHPNFTKDRRILINDWLKNKILGKHIKFKKNGNYWFGNHDGVKNTPIKRNISGANNINCCTIMGYESARLVVDNALMAGSVLYNDIDGFKSSLKGFVDVLDTMRIDGSLPYETSRGNAAIWYQNLAINILISTAEIAKYQGIDLYSFKSKNGTDIHDAIAFLLKSIENSDVIHKYASRNINPWRKGNGIKNPMDYKFQPGKYKFFKRQRNGAVFLAWYEIYKERFPNHINLKKLYIVTNELREQYNKDNISHGNFIKLPYKPTSYIGPLFNDYTGMAPTCLYYKKDEPKKNKLKTKIKVNNKTATSITLTNTNDLSQKPKINTKTIKLSPLEKSVSICTELGFTYGTEKHGDCVMKIIDK